MTHRKYRLLEREKPGSRKRSPGGGRTGEQIRRGMAYARAQDLRNQGYRARVQRIRKGKYKDWWGIFGYKKSETPPKQTLSPRKSGSGPIRVRSHARRGTKGVRAHTRKR